MNIAVKAKPPKYIFLRANTYYYIRNIAPQHRHLFEGKKQIWQTLKTDEYAEAVRRADAVTREHDAVMRGEVPAPVKFTFADEIAQADRLNITHKSSSDIRLASIEQSLQLLMERMSLIGVMANPSAIDVAALAGVSQEPAMTIEVAFQKYLEITPEFSLNLNEWDAQQKVNKYQRSVNDFIARVGDIDILTFDDGMADDYVLSIKKDVVAKKFKSEHGNRLISHVRVILREILRHEYRRKFTALDGKRVKIDDAGKRPSFTEADVKAMTKALPTSGMSDEAQAIIQLALITGCGVKELCWLTADDIKAEAKTPHICIGENELRTRVKCGGDRHRDLPIATPEGIAILKKYPTGFPSFQDEKGPSRINREFSPFFTTVTPGKSFLSARHRLDDLLKISGVDLGVKASISGHSLGGHLHYYGKSGNAYTLKQKKEAIEKALAAAPIKEEQENEKN
ncbi:DUF6538 domain-containing protein [Neorhizobium sp. NCHU2750]|uniref:DUF6538 domain-containing protein n=1 Tax=Neorhizobium sp. NCHU2750 TaxID=1825976 RepID=UPI000E711BA4